MVNHVRTLLLNEGSATSGAPDWLVDQGFSKLNLTGALRDVYDIMFEGVSSVDGKVKRVDEIVPFVFAPEMSGFISKLDGRVTVPTSPEVSSYTVASFYRTMTGGDFAFVDACLSSFSSHILFQHSGDIDVDSMLDELYVIKANSQETAKKFSACAVAVVLLMDLEYRRTQS